MIWSRTGTQGSEWNVAYINVNSANFHRLVFKGTSDGVIPPTIAIDDIKILNSKCSEYIKPPVAL